MKEPLVSVYTCVYNRADKIHRALDSVKNQTYNNIEHIIVDDGSTDNLDFLIKEYINDVNYTVKYLKKENGGKHTALNIAWDNVDGEWMINLDSDDSLEPHGIEYLVKQLDKIPNGEVDKYWCVLGRCKSSSGEMIGPPYPDDVNNLRNKELNKVIKRTKGEKIGLQRAKYLKEYRFPEPQYVKAMPEHIVWEQLNEKYKTWFTNEIIRVYYVNEGGNLTEKPKTAQHFSNKAYAAAWDIQHRNIIKCNYLKTLSKYIIGYRLATDEYRNANAFLSGFKKVDVIGIALLYLPCIMFSVLYKLDRGER